MKRHNNLYTKVYDFQNLLQAYKKSKKGKKYREETLTFSKNFEEHLIDIQNDLIYKTYNVGKYRQFFVYEPKKRLIMALQFRDRIVQWAIYNILYDIFDPRFIYDSYGCRKGKGMHRCANKLQYWIRKEERQGKCYYLKLDISKYFYRVDHKILLNILSKAIKDKDLLWLLETIINSEDTAFGLPQGVSPDSCSPEEMLFDKGMPIGNLTSQLFANIYLNELDQFSKHKLKIKRYIRYMDDIIILDHDKKHLHYLKDEIEKFLNNYLNLDLNNKTAIRPTNTGIEFVGFRIWSTHKKLKKQTALRIKRRLKIVQELYKNGEADFEYVNNCVQSYLGLFKSCDCYNLKNKIFKEFILTKDT